MESGACCIPGVLASTLLVIILVSQGDGEGVHPAGQDPLELGGGPFRHPPQDVDVIQDRTTRPEQLLPLRVPPDLREHLRLVAMANRRRSAGRSAAADLWPAGIPSQNISASRNRVSKQLSPGVYSCGHHGSDQFMNFINPQYPAHDEVTGVCRFRIRPSSPDVCQVRLDFVDTEMLLPEDGTCKDQHMTVSGTAWPVGFDRVCGLNPDQHFYIHLANEDLGGAATTTSTRTTPFIDLTIVTVRVNRSYKFGIWITQVDCRESPKIEAPGGCTQYHFGAVGTVKTFNFEGLQHLGNLNYKVCVRSSKKACFVSYSSEANHFDVQILPQEGNRNFAYFSGHKQRAPSGQSTQDCSLDYLLIPAGRANTTKIGETVDRFCGGHLNLESAKEENARVYQEITSNVFWLQVVTTVRDDLTLAKFKASRLFVQLYGEATSTGQGFRIKYSQERCPEKTS